MAKQLVEEEKIPMFYSELEEVHGRNGMSRLSKRKHQARADCAQGQEQNAQRRELQRWTSKKMMSKSSTSMF